MVPARSTEATTPRKPFAIFGKVRSSPPGGASRDEVKLERYYAARDALDLRLEDASGRPIRTTTIHIADYESRSGTSDAPELDVLIADDGYWRQRLES